MKPFRELKPTTMVVCMSLNSSVNLGCFFNLLPISKIEDSYAKSGKDKLPVVPVFGAVISAKFMGVARGYCASSRCFKNSITMMMSTGTKNVCIKLYKDKIHICGIDSNDTIVPLKDKIIEMILDSKKLSLYCLQNADKILPLRHIEEGVIIINKGKIVKLEDFDKKLINLLMFQHFCQTKEVFRDFVLWLTTGPYICEDTLDVKNIEKAMVNYNYGIGFRIIKPNVEEYLDGRDGFECRYDPNNCFVTITLPYESEFKVIKKKKQPRHTFMLYNTGKVTQSGPNEQLMEEAYERFIRAIDTIKEQIISRES